MNTQTKLDEMKAKVIAVCRQLLNENKEDIETGIKEGIYDAKENKKYLKEIDQNLILLDQFEKEKPDVYIYVEGGNIQGASASCSMGFELYDKDNFNEATSRERKEIGTPEKWSKYIEKMTKKGELKPIY